MEPTRNLVALGGELSPGVQGGHNGFKSIFPRLAVHVYGDTSTVVRYSYVVVSADCNMDLIAIAIKGFVHCIVQGLGEEMVHTGAGGIAYEHSRSQPHRCQPFEYLDVFSGVGCCHYTPVFTNIANMSA